MGRKKKAVPEVTAKCYLCEHFFHSPLNKNNQVHNPRQCVETNQEIHSIDPVCESFKMEWI